MRRALVVGAGLTGAAATYRLTETGVSVTVAESSTVVGGHVRTAWVDDVPYEPEGPHLFHTDDTDVWELVSSLVEFVPYRHRGLTRVDGVMFSWPLQLDELRRLDSWPQVDRELRGLPSAPDPTNFETWCVSQMGETLYGLFVDGYTAKQWGRPGRELAASMGPKRVELRRDGNRELFRDRHQGWPRRGYTPLVEALCARAESVLLGCHVTVDALPDLVPPGVPVVVTAPLDVFHGGVAGDLDWRGVSVTPQWFPDGGPRLPAMIVNEPDPAVPWTRQVETVHVLPERWRPRGTVVCREYPGAYARHYPVPDAAGRNAAVQAANERLAAGYQRNPLVPAGRLARYRYINMDEAIRDGLRAADQVLKKLTA
jgi:UDP-galactopyranose mutase